jgi:hypothetical protein
MRAPSGKYRSTSSVKLAKRGDIPLSRKRAFFCGYSMNWLQKSKYGYLWITLAFFVLSLVGHWLFGWFAYVNEQHTVPPWR